MTTSIANVGYGIPLNFDSLDLEPVEIKQLSKTLAAQDDGTLIHGLYSGHMDINPIMCGVMLGEFMEGDDFSRVDRLVEMLRVSAAQVAEYNRAWSNLDEDVKQLIITHFGNEPRVHIVWSTT